jgi:hypothetical protein
LKYWRQEKSKNLLGMRDRASSCVEATRSFEGKLSNLNYYVQPSIFKISKIIGDRLQGCHMVCVTDLAVEKVGRVCDDLKFEKKNT